MKKPAKKRAKKVIRRKIRINPDEREFYISNANEVTSKIRSLLNQFDYSEYSTEVLKNINGSLREILIKVENLEKRAFEGPSPRGPRANW